MRAVLLEVDERMLAERHRLGLDRHDEVWEGILHMVPPAASRHQQLELQLAVVLEPIVRQRGWYVQVEAGVFAAADDYRVPDVVVFAPEARSERGVDGAPEVVIEIRSPGDESDAKVPWYLARGAGCVLVVDRDSLALDLHTSEGRIAPDGAVVLGPLGVRVSPSGDTLNVGGTDLRL